MRGGKPCRHWREKFFSPESIQRDLSGLWPVGQTTGLAALAFLTGSLVKVGCFLILPSRHQQSIEIMQKAQNFLGVKVKCRSGGALGKKRASVNWELVNFQNLTIFLTLLHRERARISSLSEVLFFHMELTNYVFLPRKAWSYKTHGSFSASDALQATHTWVYLISSPLFGN